MESTGTPGRIQISNTTASLITAAGKTTWIKPRDDAVMAKGKGVINTFWLNIAPMEESRDTASCESGDSFIALEDATEGLAKPVSESQDRLVDWVSELLMDQLKKIVSELCFNRFLQLE